MRTTVIAIVGLLITTSASAQVQNLPSTDVSSPDPVRNRTTVLTSQAARLAEHFDLEGRWQLFLPAGFEREMNLVRSDGGQYTMRSGASNFNGRYKLNDGRLQSVELDGDQPSDESYTWMVRTPYMLVLERQTGDVGANYTSAILFRPQPETSRGESAAAAPAVELDASHKRQRVERQQTGSESSAAGRSKWSYRVTDLSDFEQGSVGKRIATIEEHLNELGHDGWELVQVHGKVAIFRRPGG
ncbi:MAG: hypothetical protein KDA47_15415 [Planctomycetales bacterium]|nr:hypothetical protein [Planctomycetales bacterium]